ncbi:MAG: hypothetical protein COV44_05525 [Deltaproteobacteria bacterium CG11_big_fil_rev_8_21_14_0_20_45_16]|nr:MAG: hypothetical protein COV44_05525 [Deltaproteobacteria bacterium CG11_big_fil_rev_8_21_14_0_20_45_16]
MSENLISGRDLLQTGQVNVEEVIEFLKPECGLHCKRARHPILPKIQTATFRSDVSRGGLPVSWYVKCYCLFEGEEESWFVSVYSTLERKRR